MARRLQKPAATPLAPGDSISASVSMRHERLIGRLVVEWSWLEAAMEDLIWHFFDLPLGFGRIITARMDASSRLTMLRALNTLALDPSDHQDLKEILDQIDILREDRNLVIHGSWGTKGDGLPIAGSLRIKDTPFTVIGEGFSDDRMRVLCQTIAAVRNRLIPFIIKAEVAHPRARERSITNSPKRSAHK